MRFTVTSGVGVTEVVDRLKARELLLSTSSCYSGVSETMFASLMRTAGVELRRIYAGWQPRKLQCCPIIKTELLSLS
jgi:hypothetical protein